MVAIEFPQQNAVLGKPESMTDEQCYALPIHRYTTHDGFPAILSCWKVTPKDIERMKETGVVWVHTLGQTLAPFSVFTEPAFESAEVV